MTICIISSHLKCAWLIALTHIVVGVLLFVCGVLDRLYNDFWIRRFIFFDVFCGVTVGS